LSDIKTLSCFMQNVVHRPEDSPTFKVNY
jgi:hypothetical protein